MGHGRWARSSGPECAWWKQWEVHHRKGVLKAENGKRIVAATAAAQGAAASGAWAWAHKGSLGQVVYGM